MEKPVTNTLAVVIPVYRMHSQMFNNMLDGIREVDAQKRIEDKTNHFTWMTGNLVNCRYWLAGVLDMPEKDPNEDLFKEAKSLDTEIQYPLLEDLKKQWHKISALLYERLLSIDHATLEQAYEFGMHVSYIKENKLNMVGMGMDRESYLLGQLGLMRKALGYEGVKYDVDDGLNY